MTNGEYIGAGSATTKLLLHLNGNSVDSSGNGNNGTITGASSVNGKFGGGYDFKNPVSSGVATTDYIYVPNSATMNPGSNNFTAVMWFYCNTTGAVANKFLFVKYNNANQDNVISLYHNASYQLECAIRDGNGNDINCSSSIAINDSKWHCAILTRNGTTGSLYLDGSLVGTKTNASIGTIDLNNANGHWWIGAFSNSTSMTFFSNNAFTGILDEHIFDIGKAWSASEVKKYYTYAKGRFNN